MSAPITLLILGATSDIARAVARRHAALGHTLILAGRDPVRLDAVAADLRVRFDATVSVQRLDVLESTHFAAFIDDLPTLPDIVLCAVGVLGDQARAERDPEHADDILCTNFTAPALLLGVLANRMAARGSGTLIGVSSVAGERGRARNYVYGSAKAGFTAFLSGLRNRMVGAGVRVITIKPGFVRTRMTAGLALPRLLTAEPDDVAQAIIRAQAGGRDIVYVRPIWRWIMAVIRAIPESVFKRLSL